MSSQMPSTKKWTQFVSTIIVKNAEQDSTHKNAIHFEFRCLIGLK